MNRKRELQRIKSYGLFDRAFNIKRDIVKFNKGDTPIHEIAKSILSFEALKMGYSFVSEAIFTTKKRADIFILDICEAWEIVGSETEKSIEKKKNEYPCDVIFFNAKDVIRKFVKSEGIKCQE